MSQNSGDWEQRGGHFLRSVYHPSPPAAFRHQVGGGAPPLFFLFQFSVGFDHLVETRGDVLPVFPHSDLCVRVDPVRGPTSCRDSFPHLVCPETPVLEEDYIWLLFCQLVRHHVDQEGFLSELPPRDVSTGISWNDSCESHYTYVIQLN